MRRQFNKLPNEQAVKYLLSRQNFEVKGNVNIY